jgi:hypothetical protein
MSLPNLKLMLGLLLMAIAPAMAQADWLGFRNNTKQPVIVRVFIVTEGQVRASSAFKLFPGEIRWDLVKDNTPRLVIVSEPTPPQRALVQKQIEAPVKGDVLYGIQPRISPQGTSTSADLVKLAEKRGP